MYISKYQLLFYDKDDTNDNTSEENQNKDVLSSTIQNGRISFWYSKL